MPYKISGTINESADIIVINQSDWAVETTTSESAGSFEIGLLVSGTKTILARRSDGYAMGYGNVDALYYYYYAPGDRGVWGGGCIAGIYYDVMDYITISSAGNAQDFGNLTLARVCLGATSNGNNDRGVFAGGENAGYKNRID